jgi:hypothetical protein
VNSYIGVKEVSFSPLRKHDLLLFDQIAIPQLNISITQSPTAQRAADLEWLAGEGLLLDVAAEDLIRNSKHLDPVAVWWLYASFALGSNPLVQEFIPAAQQLELENLAVRLCGIASVRSAASYLEVAEGKRAAALGLEGLWPRHYEWCKSAEQLSEILQLAYARCHAIPLPPEQRKLLDRIHNILHGVLPESFPREDSVVSIVLHHLPVPDEQVSWEQIADFKKDEQTRFRALELRKWMRKVTQDNLPPMELHEELEYMVAQYNDHMRMHRMKTQSGMVETLLTVPATIGEHLTRFRFGEAVQTLFSVRKHKAALLEAERAAPSREIAFIIDAQRKFGRRGTNVP